MNCIRRPDWARAKLPVNHHRGQHAHQGKKETEGYYGSDKERAASAHQHDYDEVDDDRVPKCRPARLLYVDRPHPHRCSHRAVKRLQDPVNIPAGRGAEEYCRAGCNEGGECQP